MGPIESVKGSWRRGLGIAAIPPLATAVFIAFCGTNVPFWDEWDLAPLLEKLATHRAGIADFFQQQSEHRFFFPKLILAPLALQTHWNVTVELWLSLAVALAGFAGLLLLMRSAPAGIVAIVSLAYFSLAAYENWLWGWQFSWFFADALFIWAVVAAARRRIVAAAILCFMATFSVAYGIVSWIALAPLLWRTPKRAIVVPAWSAAFAASMALYLYRFDFTAGTRVRGSIFADAGYVLAVVGSPLTRIPLLAAILGAILIVVFAMFATRDAVWFSVGLFALGFAGINAIGRSGLGLSQALTPRYITVGSLLLIAVLNMMPLNFRWRAEILAGLALALIAQSLTSIPLGWQTKQARDESRVCLALILVNVSSDCPPGLYPKGETLSRDAEAMDRLGIRPLVTPAAFVNAPPAHGSLDSVRPESQTPHPAIMATGGVDLPGHGTFVIAATESGARKIVAADLIRGRGTARWSLLFPPALAERRSSFQLWLFVPDERRLYPFATVNIRNSEEAVR